MKNFPASLEDLFLCQLLQWGAEILSSLPFQVIKLIKVNISLPTEICCRIKGKNLSSF